MTATIPVGNLPIGTALNEDRNLIYVTNSLDSTISIIDGNLDVVAATITIFFGGSTTLTSVAVSENLNILYVVDLTNNSVYVIDGVTNMVTTTISVGANPRDITFL
ncbi:hypothetical protein LC087_17695 [Bacillus carboniphilus]|uniref:Uncharacterized protein n=1 Tax=Bacillus carboniphilus TaxID=86663 RepID=A0ABY9JSY0_9BACI|nr:hypothetical protein [Bacillus carboniphilus]WLR42505.1 hypothetical protein LC087_17695 [Bacillus carboniphilus]